MPGGREYRLSRRRRVPGLPLETQREVNEAIDEVLAERDAISGRIESDDWLVFPTSDGVVEVDLNDLDGYIPLAQQMLAADPELKATVIETLKQANPEAWKALGVGSTFPASDGRDPTLAAWHPSSIFEHFHDFYELALALQGSGIQITSAGQHPISRGTAIFVAPGRCDVICLGDQAVLIARPTTKRGQRPGSPPSGGTRPM